MSVTAAQGFVAAGAACGVKASGALDLAIVATADGRPVPAAATFTRNKAAAAPVQVCRAHLAHTDGHAAAVVLNSGNANAATGADGREHATRMASTTASALGCDTEHVLVCSTGLIGIPLPIDRIDKAIPDLAASAMHRSSNSGDAARAIMTTDTADKQVVIARDGFTVGGMAKGAAMLAPDMATMLAVLTTDALVDPVVLQTALAAAVAGSFNRLSVDGCTSTNDTVILLASGRAGRVDPAALADAVFDACLSLAKQMAADAEGATKVVTVTVEGARTNDEARQAARKVAESQLTKCSWYGQDPYWGRVASDLGTAGVEFDIDRLSVRYGGVEVCRGGVAVAHDEAALASHMAGRAIELTADLGLGTGVDWILTNDLTHAYVDENMGTS
ncbi:MAG TPA: bifunctional glutamate N-acetyltransferase/amino-acid acetyltransferase ArgJ [Acidimicrobiales bacterium]